VLQTAPILRLQTLGRYRHIRHIAYRLVTAPILEIPQKPAYRHIDIQVTRYKEVLADPELIRYNVKYVISNLTL
jgi:hypothetical protein